MKPFIADMHMHTILSGHAYGTIREMAAEASQRDLRLIGITEHGPGMPGTCDPVLFRNLADAPRMLYGVEVLYGCEVNVLSGGELSLDRRHLDLLDYAVAGIHGHCYANEGIVRNTDYVIRCMADPKVRFISHPDDSNYPLSYPELVSAAKEYGVALEVNNNSLRRPTMRPGCVENYRTMVPLCMEQKVPLIVNTDAHDPFAVGDFTLTRALLEELGVPDDMILSNDAEKLKAFLLQK